MANNDINKFFTKDNRKEFKNETYPASSQFKDENGKIVEWELRHLTSAEVDRLNKESKSDEELGINMVVAAVVSPNLRNSALQDEFGVKGAKALLHELIQSPGEMNALADKVMRMNGYNQVLDDLIDKAKNS